MNPKFLYFFISAILFLLPDTSVLAQAFNQQIYEEMYKVKCAKADAVEISALHCKTKTVQVPEELNLDSAAEHIVFTDLAIREQQRLSCLTETTKYLIQDKDMQQRAVNTTCSHLDGVSSAIDNIEFLKKWIKSFETINDPTIRVVPREQMERNDLILRDLRARLGLYEEYLKTFKEFDPLLGSSEIYEFVESELKPNFLGIKKDPVAICEKLKSKVGLLLQKDLQKHQENSKLIQNRIESKEGFTKDTEIKTKLWNTVGRSELVKTFSNEADFEKSTYCRMEGRYGVGAVNAEKLILLASFGLGGGISLIGKIGSIEKIRKISALRKLMKFATYASIVTGFSFTANSINEACQQKLTAVSGKDVCESREDFKSNYYRTQQGNECLIASAGGILMSGLSIMGLANLHKGKFPPLMSGEMDSRIARTKSANNFFDRIEDRWRNWDLGKSAEKVIPRLEGSIEGLSPKDAFTKLSTTYGFTEKQGTKLLKILKEPGDLEKMNQVLSQSASGKFVKFEEAAWASKQLGRVGVDDVFQFHGTSEKAMNGILTSMISEGQPTMKTANDVGVYAIPIAHSQLSTAQSYFLTGTVRAASPEASVVFQGEAAALFNSPKIPTVAGNVAYRGSTTRSPVGNLVIDEFKMDGPNMIVTKAHVSSLENNKKSISTLLISNFGIETIIIGEGVIRAIPSKPNK